MSSSPRHRIAAIALAAAAALGGCMADRVETSRAAVADSGAFSVEPIRARARLLVIGDSTAVGTGASSAARSVVGLLAARSPSLSIENRGENGARFRDLTAQLDAANGKRYDAILILAGGNDVIRLSSEATMREDLDRVAVQAKAMAPLVIVMPAGNLGSAPVFPLPVSWLMAARSRTLHAVVREEAASRGLAYVDLYREIEDDAFAQDPRSLLAADGLHPSDAGYALWLEELLAQSPLATVAELGHVTSVPVLSSMRDRA